MSKLSTASLIVPLLAVIVIATPPRALASWLIDRTGTLVEVDGVVLGDDADSLDMVEGEDGGAPSFESQDPSDDRKLMELKKREESRTKLESEIQTREKKLDARKEQVKSLISRDQDKLKVKQIIENKDGKVDKTTDTELEPGEKIRLQHKAGEVDISAMGDNIDIGHKDFTAHAKFPLSIGENNELIVTRPDGTQKTVTILPDQAAEKMRLRGLDATSQEADLVEENGEPVYKFATTQEKRFLGIFRTRFESETTVSADTGEVVDNTSSETSPLRKLLLRLSF